MEIELKNKQQKIANTCWILSLIFAVFSYLPFVENNPLTDIWAVAIISFFLFISCLITGFVFKKRAGKMKKLLNGEKLLFRWELDNEMHRKFVEHLWESAKNKNKALLWVISILFAVIVIPFLFILEDDELWLFVAIIFSVWGVIFFFGLFFPWYYKNQNLKGDKQILIGEKYAYINGYFHNWDFPLSGMEKIKAIKTPFAGIQLVYYYTDRTLRHSHELKIPVPPHINKDEVVDRLKRIE